jgi:hypothetical protein
LRNAEDKGKTGRGKANTLTLKKITILQNVTRGKVIRASLKL